MKTAVHVCRLTVSSIILMLKCAHLTARSHEMPTYSPPMQVGRGGGTLECGFNCTTGWDPVTGMGTPKFGAMLKAAMAVVGVAV